MIFPPMTSHLQLISLSAREVAEAQRKSHAAMLQPFGTRMLSFVSVALMTVELAHGFAGGMLSTGVFWWPPDCVGSHSETLVDALSSVPVSCVDLPPRARAYFRGPHTVAPGALHFSRGRATDVSSKTGLLALPSGFR